MKNNIQCLFITIAVILVLFTVLSAQDELYMPLDIKKAYETGTRSYDGQPGENYWQNRADYEIEVRLDPKIQLIKGEETISYSNNSPDSLKGIVLRFYQDIYQIGNMRDFQLDSADIHAGTSIFYVKLDGEEIDLSKENKSIRKRGTNMVLKLTDPLPPDNDLEVEIGWQVQLPAIDRIRMGAYGDSAFFIAYWYPQIAVYDDIDGWDNYSYTGTQEFYNEFGDFDVKISVPGDFIVWATGILQNGEDVLGNEFYKRYQQAFISDEIIHIVAVDDYENRSITKENDSNTWHFKAAYVPDFAFAASNCYLWDATSLIVDDKSGRRVMVDAAFRKNSEDFYEVAQIGKETVEYLSYKLPGVPFPYPKMTVFNGSGGMEFPMMVNDGTTFSRSRTVGLTSHEITHTYFPFYMGTNEKKYAWMDEGWAVMLPFEFQNKSTEGYDQIIREIKRFESVAGREIDLSLMIPSVSLRGLSYRIHAYGRPAIAYVMLEDLMGKENFRKALIEFINRWNGKHPIPYDFFFTINEVQGSSLNWFWKPWFFERGYPDLSIKSVVPDRKGSKIVIERVGQMPVRVEVKFYFKDGTEKVVSRTAEVWKNGVTEITLDIEHSVEIERIELGDDHIPDIDKSNNSYENT